MRGYKEEGTTTTPFDMTVLNDLDRFHLAGRRGRPRAKACSASVPHLKQFLRDKLVEHKHYIARARRRHAGGQKLALACGVPWPDQPAASAFAWRADPLLVGRLDDDAHAA